MTINPNGSLGSIIINVSLLLTLDGGVGGGGGGGRKFSSSGPSFEDELKGRLRGRKEEIYATATILTTNYP